VKVREFWFTSLILAIIALCLQISSLREASNGMKLRAQAVTATEQQKIVMKMEAANYSERSGIIGLAGLILAVASTGCLIQSIRRREPAWRSVPATFLTFWLLMQFALI
jgi:hypothetical protein